MLANPALVVWRNRLRRNAAARWLYQRWMARHDYEDNFGKKLLAAVDGSAAVWDVGANVGLYTTGFLARGAREVVCFEPAPAAVHSLQTKFAAEPRVRVVAVALSNVTCMAPFVANGAAPTNRLDTTGLIGMSDARVEVPVRRGDELLAELALPMPSLIKVDVEGYELEVLDGCKGLLCRPEVRSVWVEIHFSILHARGLDDAPAAIVALLENAGLSVRWLDLSHIQATRR